MTRKGISEKSFNNLTKQARRLKLEDTIWRLEVGKAFVFAHFTRQNNFFQKTLKINAPNSFFQNEPKFFYLILDFFNKFWQLEIEQFGERSAEIEDRIRRLKLEKRSFWPILRDKTLKTLTINAPNSFFQNEPKFFYIILDCFNKFLTTWNWTIWRKKRGDRS